MNKFYFLLIVLMLLTSCTAAPASPAPTPVNIPSLIFPTQPPACSSAVAPPTPGPETPSLFPPENAADRVRGAEDPLVTITAYSDYQDVRSAEFAQAVERLLDEHPEEVRVINRIFPLMSINDKAA